MFMKVSHNLTFSSRWSLLSRYNVSFECIVLLCILYYVSIHLFSYLVVHTIQSSIVEHQNLYHMSATSDCSSDSSQSRVCFDAIDVVYTWVNGSDPDWLRTKAAASSSTDGKFANGVDGGHRFRDNDELRYSLRSLEKNAPWVGKIYIVTNGQVPSWLNVDHPKIYIVPHEVIFPDPSHLPTFSSSAIETHLHRIPGLSNKFIYFNDDVFLGAPIYIDDFITQSNGQKVYLAWTVPSCAPRCSDTWVKDGVCDSACNVSACDFDGGDCLPSSGKSPSFFDQDQDHSTFDEEGEDAGDGGEGEDSDLGEAENTRRKREDSRMNPDQDLDQNLDEDQQRFVDELKSLKGDRPSDDGFGAEDAAEEADWERRLCAKGCNVGWVGDGTCDVSCKVAACGFDAGDCAGFSEGLHNTSVVLSTRVERVGASMKRLSADGDEVGVLRVNQTIDTTKRWPLLVLILDVTPVFGSNKVLDVKCPHETTLRCLQMRHPKDWAGRIMVLLDIKTNPLDVVLGVSGFSSLKPTLGPVELRLGLHLRENTSAFALNMSDARISSAFTVKSAAAGYPWDGGAGESNDFDFNEDTYGVGSSGLDSTENSTEKPEELDVFGKSIRFVNNLMDEAYGTATETRSVIAHMPHLIDKRVMTRVQEKWKNEFLATSSHQFRHETDMQYAFTYFYFLMNEPRDISFMEIWVQLDTNEDGVLDANEIRSMAALITEFDEESYLSDDDIIALMKEIMQGEEVPQDPSSWSISPRTLSNADGVVQRLVGVVSASNVLGGVDKNFEMEGLDQVTFVMMDDNATKALRKLDSIRAKRTKFICVNDDMNHSRADGEALQMMQDFYRSMFPKPSAFELDAAKERQVPLVVKEMTQKNRVESGGRFSNWTVHGYSVVFVSSLLIIPSAPFVAAIVYATWKRRSSPRVRASSKNRSRIV